LPKKKLITPENVLSHLEKKRKTSIDLIVVDIDSFDLEVVEKMLIGQIAPKVFVVEYNPSLPYAEVLSFKYTHLTHDVKNKRFYGASVGAWIKLFSKFNYDLIHISGFCNLHFVKKEFSVLFQSPNIPDEITDTNEKVLKYVAEFCLPGFVPSWLDEPPLTSQELDLMR
jgi:hypothetical protein